MKKILCGLLLVLAAASSFATAPATWPMAYTRTNGLQRWAYDTTSPLVSPNDAVFTAAAGGAFVATASISPLLADGRAVALTVVRGIASSEILAGTAALLGTPLGMVASAAAVAYALSRAPSLGTWISGDTSGRIRQTSGGGLEKNSNCAVAPCYGYSWPASG